MFFHLWRQHTGLESSLFSLRTVVLMFFARLIFLPLFLHFFMYFQKHLPCGVAGLLPSSLLSLKMTFSRISERCSRVQRKKVCNKSCDLCTTSLAHLEMVGTEGLGRICHQYGQTAALAVPTQVVVPIYPRESRSTYAADVRQRSCQSSFPNKPDVVDNEAFGDIAAVGRDSPWQMCLCVHDGKYFQFS